MNKVVVAKRRALELSRRQGWNHCRGNQKTLSAVEDPDSG